MGPPRLLLGAALLFWGAMNDRALSGLAAALLVEAAHWTRIRWDFPERARVIAWRLSLFFLLVALILTLLQGARLHTPSRVFSWLPAILLPLQFVQSYGSDRSISMATFSMLVRQRRDRARRHGLPFRDIRFHFGHVLLAATLLAASLGPHASAPIFYPVLIGLVAWAIIAATGRGWRALGPATTTALAAATLIGIGGQLGLRAFHKYVTSGRWAYDGDPGLHQARERQTSIGSLGRIKQSPEIHWRLIPEQGPLPRLMRIASYSSYHSTHWQANLLPEKIESFKDDFKSPQTLQNPANPDDPGDSFVIAAPDLSDLHSAIDPTLPRFRLRGAVPKQGGLLPLPADSASLHHFVFEDLERSSFGTFRLTPSQPVADARVLWHETFATEQPPWQAIDHRRSRSAGKIEQRPPLLTQPDLHIPAREAATLRHLVDALGLRDIPLPQKIALLQRHFIGKFRYTRYNSVPRDQRDRQDSTLLATFLEKTRAGHCEHFATATTLLLREAGVPTRYTSGFAVMEIDPDTGNALLRGTHAHAWCRAWDATKNRWLDVDLTPPDWASVETPRKSHLQSLTDHFQFLREDFLVWRDQPGNLTRITAFLLGPIFITLTLIGRHLWRSRRRLDPNQALPTGKHPKPSPLQGLEKPARHFLGERPPGTPLAPWLRQLSPRLPDPTILEKALALHHRLRFDPAKHDPALLTELHRHVSTLRHELTRQRKTTSPPFPHPAKPATFPPCGPTDES
ncbi:MAG: hypothetical protein EAZ65_04670 [Verrucomicrobia bacterium]|nr:MAG: hypothetical protein EAZ84_00890 [Verrucomicrobiota bacterium]TAE88036.1 MAG: hypothetical protein EAZ82_05925 [Verrucomicrobiota bacterium]TAF26260.1 MAG: hypothetical protein EAZ71_05490 [Verrucomicrobiota bacterium]TAF41814.1 MAG: hypothetical protein EAZ65_04670 [Verrucomicrobiota bacterium]